MSKLFNYIFVLIVSVSLAYTLMPVANAEVQNLYLDRLNVENGLSQGTVNSILQDDSGFIWLGTENGVNFYDGYTVRQLPGPENTFNNFSIYNLIIL